MMGYLLIFLLIVGLAAYFSHWLRESKKTLAYLVFDGALTLGIIVSLSFDPRWWGAAAAAISAWMTVRAYDDHQEMQRIKSGITFLEASDSQSAHDTARWMRERHRLPPKESNDPA